MTTRSAIFIVSTLVLGACSKDKDFKGGVATNSPEVKVEIDSKDVEKAKPKPKPPETVEEVARTLELKVRSSTSPIDMIWVVDNSGSMNEEIAQVQLNISNFVGTLSQSVDLRLNFISFNGFPRGLQLDTMNQANDIKQVPFYVGSYNLMSMLAASLCKAETTVASADNIVTKICDQTVQSSTTNGGIHTQPGLSQAQLNENSDVQALNVKGSLVDRLRPGAVKVLVFVTDDIAKGAVTDKNFMQLTNLDPATTHAYAFAGLTKSRPGCEISAVGDTYIALSKATGGEVFDICEANWSNNFSKLTEKVIKLTSTVFDIPASATSLKSVKIKGVVLTEKQYSVNAGKLTILDKSLLSDGDSVVVEYLEKA
ncbi:MAG: hypothetical protein EOP04_19950 [Proteobacteria bacterium]|nr:MAG: hypothetical protein EOP04_19950 [Pseudomonadota bacterium]